MNTPLNNLFRPEQTVTSLVTVRRRLAAGRYEVEDVAGRLQAVEADAAEFFPVGVEVVVQNGRIVGSGYQLGRHRVVAV